MMTIKTAMILAAGRGERLRPLTQFIPKALCPVQGIPLIEYHLKNLIRAGYQRIVINHAYLGGKIRNQVGNGSRWGVEICYAPEPPGGLETGGGIFNALPLLGNDPFLTVNADIYTDFLFDKIALPYNSKTHLILISNPPQNPKGDFGLDEQGKVTLNTKNFTFAGIALYSPEVFCKCKPGRFSATPLLRDLARTNQLTGQIHRGIWHDIGSPERLELLNNIMKG